MLAGRVLHTSTMRLHVTDLIQGIVVILDVMVHSSDKLRLVGAESA